MAAFWLLVTEGGADLVDVYDVAGWQKSTFFKGKSPLYYKGLYVKRTV